MVEFGFSLKELAEKGMVAPAPSPPPTKTAAQDEEEDATSSAAEPFDRDMTKTPPPITTGKRKRTAKRGKIGKKPADMPRRPLSGYNYFFSEQRSKILEEQSRVKDEKRDIFTTLGRIVADRWKKLGDKEKEKYNELAAKDLIRYRKEMEKYNEKIAMRNRMEAERLNPEETKEPVKPVAVPAAAAATARSDQLESSISSGGDRQAAAARAIAQGGQGSMLLATPFAQYSGLLPQQDFSGVLGAGFPLTGGFPRVAQGQSQIDFGRMAFTQHHNLATRLDPMLARTDLQHLLGQLPPPPDSSSRVHILYPTATGGAPGIGQHPFIQLPPQSSQAPLDANSLLASRASTEATLLQSLSGQAASQLQASAGPPGSSWLDHIQRQQQTQQTEDETIRQAYARMLQRQQAEEEEAIRRLRQRGWPPGGPF